jgi:thiol:disulfide interchange protein DsbD
MILRKIFFIGMLVSLVSLLSAQNFDPVKWDYRIEQISQDEFDIIFKAEIEDGWTVYSMYIEEGGPVPTSIWYESEGVVENKGDAVETGHRKEGMDPIFEMKVIKFLDDEDYQVRQRVKVLDPSKKLTGYLTYMTCDDERCLPPTDVDFEIDFGDGNGAVDQSSDTQVPVASSTSAESIASTKATLSESEPVAWSVDVKKKLNPSTN